MSFAAPSTNSGVVGEEQQSSTDSGVAGEEQQSHLMLTVGGDGLTARMKVWKTANVSA